MSLSESAGGNHAGLGILHLASQPAISANSLVKVLGLLLELPVVAISEVFGDSIVLGAFHCSPGLPLFAGDRLHPRQSLAQQVIEDNRLLVVEDARLFGPRAEGLLARGLQSFAGVPLSASGGTPFGVLWVSDVRPRSFELRILALLEQTAPLVAEGLLAARESKRLLEDRARLVAEADRLKSEFLATTSHELRTPLNSMLGFLKLILEDVCEDRREEHDLVRHAFTTGTQLAALLEDLLDLARIESGSVVLTPEPLDAKELLVELTPLATVQTRNKGLEYSCSVPDDGPVHVLGDRRRLRQVYLNLLGNAIKYTPTGNVTVELSVSGEPPAVCVSVIDTGIGMDADTLASVRSGSFGARLSRGSGGLGLMIARRLLTLMGGTLTFDSPGLKRGTSVVARLPALKAAELAQVASRPAEGPLPDGNRGPLRILLVEDDPGTARAAALSLRRLGGHEVTVSEDVPEILRLTAEGRIDAVLMDVSLATSSYQGRLVDGLEITRLLRADSRSRAIPVLLMTAHAMAGDRERMLQASGAEGYESKPVEDYRRLMDRLQGLVSQRRAAS